MIQVSNEFKKAIKGQERRIKGYVEVLYDMPDIEIYGDVQYASSNISTINDAIYGSRNKPNYGTLDYLPLDGSQLVMSQLENNDISYITDEIVEQLLPTHRDSVDITLTFDETTINGITIYLKDNGLKWLMYGTSIDYMESYETPDYKNVIQIIFDNPITTDRLYLQLYDFEHKDRRIKIEKIDLGITNTYKDEDLLEFTVDEEVNKLVEETPTNEADITLNNMQDLFNPLNPQGIVKFLTENVKIIPYIGVLTENNGIEYVKMGEFFFDSYTNNSDATTTLVGKNLMKQLESKDITNGLAKLDNFAFVDRTNSTYNNTLEGMIHNSGYEIQVDVDDRVTGYLQHLEDANMINYIRGWAVLQGTIFYVNRNNNLVCRKLYNNVDNLTKNELINDASFKFIDKINTIKVFQNIRNHNDSYSGTETTYKMFDDYELILEKPEQIFVVQKPISSFVSNYTQVFTGGTGTILWDNAFFLIAKVNGTVGDTVKMTLSQTTYYSGFTTTNEEKLVSTFQKNVKDKEVVLETRQQTRFITSSGGKILEYAPSYEMSFEYNGDPSLEAGDYINVETPYGYKQLFIQKNRFKFDGGLEGSIEGVE